MAFKDYINSITTAFSKNKAKQNGSTNETLNPDQGHHHFGNRPVWYPIISEHFDGEKTPGEMGVIRNLIPNHNALRHRAYEADLKSDIIKIITGKFFKWVVGVGLKLQSEPNTDALATEGITIPDPATFSLNVEARFNVFSRSKFSDFQQMENLHQRAWEAFKTSFLGGDCLIISRIDEKNNLNIQVVDGSHIRTPFLGNNFLSEAKNRGNTIKHGIELNNKNQHIAFYVLVDHKESLLGKFERIPAKGKATGRTLAWMIYGDKHRIDHHRGVPVITAILEKVEKLDRYTEAAVGSAEERAKIVFSIEHTKDSDGENVLLSKARQASGMSTNAAKETSGFALGEKTAATVAATTSKQTFNMPIGATLKSLASTTELQYEPFFKAVFYSLCAAVDIPPEVALQLYEQNYSSSRAAINGWDYIVKVYRQKFADKFYQKFYEMWLELEIIKNKIPAPGYIKALQTDNFMITEAYSFARFTGANMPHIDPLKEVKAIRALLGKDAGPLISREQAVENLGEGDWNKNIQKYNKETPSIITPVDDERNNNQDE